MHSAIIYYEWQEYNLLYDWQDNLYDPSGNKTMCSGMFVIYTAVFRFNNLPMLSSQHTCSVQADPYVDSKIIFVIRNCCLYLHLKYVYFYEGIAIKS